MYRGISFELNTDAKQKGDKTIYCIVCYKMGRLKLSTGRKISPCNWDKNKHRATGRDNKKVNEKLELMERKIIGMIDRMELHENIRPSWGLLKQQLKDEFRGSKRTNFFDIYDEFIEIRTNKLNIDTITKYKTIRKHLEGFNPNLTFDSIDEAFYEDLENYYISKEFSNNYIRKNFQFIKAFLRWAMKRRYHNNINGIEVKNIKKEDVPHIALTKDDLRKLITCVVGERLRRVRDFWLFMFFTGQSYEEASSFKYEDVHEGKWHFFRKKPGKYYDLALNNHALAVLKKYDNKLPIISNQKTNNYLKELGQAAGFFDSVTTKGKRKELKCAKWEKFTCHTARRTFDSRLALYVPDHVRNRYTRHENAEMKSLYYKEDDGEVVPAIDAGFDEILNFNN